MSLDHNSSFEAHSTVALDNPITDSYAFDSHWPIKEPELNQWKTFSDVLGSQQGTFSGKANEPKVIEEYGALDLRKEHSQQPNGDAFVKVEAESQSSIESSPQSQTEVPVNYGYLPSAGSPESQVNFEYTQSSSSPEDQVNYGYNTQSSSSPENQGNYDYTQTASSSDDYSPQAISDPDITPDSSSQLAFWTQLTSSGALSGTLDADLSSTSCSSSRDWKQNALRYPPCVVCTGKSSGLHYGCYTCEACKNFFRRYLLRSGGFICKKSNNCVISNRSRGNCSGCRLKKCLEVGMSKEKSKIGRYTHSQRAETIREVNKLEGKEYPDEMAFKQEADNELPQVEHPQTSSEEKGENFDKKPMNEACGKSENEDTLTDSENELLETLVDMMDKIEHFGELGKTPEGIEQIIKTHHEKYLAKVKLIGPLKAIPKDEYFTLLKLYNIDLDGRWSLFKQEANNCAHIVDRYCKFAYKIPGFQELSVQDQEILLKIGHCDFFIILMHEGYDNERQIFLEMNGVPSHIEEAADKIFSRHLIEVQCEIFKRWQKACLIQEEKALLCAMSLLCSDRVDLNNPLAVEKIHSDLTEILLKVLNKNHGKDAKKRFSKFIDILTFCRQASDAYFKEYQEMSQFDMVQEVAPAFPTLCPDKF